MPKIIKEDFESIIKEHGIDNESIIIVKSFINLYINILDKKLLIQIMNDLIDNE